MKAVTNHTEFMQKEARLLKDKAVSSLLLSIEHFNSISEIGRFEAVLIFLDHSFEMLLKACILHKKGRIREPREHNTIGFDKCVRKALSETKFLDEDQALVLQAINGLRDAAQHHLVELSESQLYFHAQSGVTLFRDILQDVFGEQLSSALPSRVLPVSTVPLTDPHVMFSSEADAVKHLLAPGKRRRAEATAKLRGIAIVDGALQGSFVQPSDYHLAKLGERLVAGENFADVFPGIGSINFTTDGSGAQIGLRISKKEGVPVSIVPEGTPDSGVVALKRVDELGFYNLGHRELAKKLGLTGNKTTAVITLMDLKADLDSCKQIAIGKAIYQRYSQRAVDKIRAYLDEHSIDAVWAKYRELLDARKVSAS